MLHSSDKLATRLCQILMRFNNGESFSVDELALEFGVDKRTILRDFERLSFMPIKKEKGRYSLKAYVLGHLSFKDIHNFAILSGMSELYPSLDKDFIIDWLNSKILRRVLKKMGIYGVCSYRDCREAFKLHNKEAFKDFTSLKY